MNFEDIVKLEGNSEEIDDCLYELLDKQGALYEINRSIKLLNLKEIIRKVSNLVLLVLGVGTLVIPNTLVGIFISFCILRLSLVKFVGFKARCRSEFRRTWMRRQFLEAEISDLIIRIKELKEEYGCQNLFLNDSGAIGLEDVKNNSYCFVSGVSNLREFDDKKVEVLENYSQQNKLKKVRRK